MDDEKENKKISDEEMQGPRGLASAEKVDGCRECGVEGRGQGETGPDNEGKQNEDDHEIGGALNDVVRVVSSGIGRRAAKALRKDIAKGAPIAIGGRREQVSREVAIEQARDDVDKAGEYEDPGGFEMKIAGPSILVGHYIVVAAGNRVARCRDGDFKERSGAGVAGFSPVEARVGDDDFAARDEQSQE